jgi:Protein of unknown function (DUF1003)
MKEGKVPGVGAQEDDLMIDLEQILPAPHIEGKVVSVRIEGDKIIQVFGGSDVAGSWTQAFDPFPFGFLALIVSSESVFLTIFVLIRQSRMARRSEPRSHLDLQVGMFSHLLKPRTYTS